MIEPLAARIANLGWHIQFNVEGEQIIELAFVKAAPERLVWRCASGVAA